ncbi:hypothetical protein [Pseudalkalibacillus sp. SCS-8]|uniref:hypothetical protein n=1 Tax=Pseudalkalibacillus nanhaiensis TaxID=3115291 RepID=UPI0032D9DC62
MNILKKSFKVTTITLALTITTGSLVYLNSSEASTPIITLDKNSIKDANHFKKIKSLQHDPSAMNEYLSKLNTNELLETAAEFANQGEYTLDQEGLVLVSHLQKKFKVGVPFQEINNHIKDNTHNNKFRMFLIDSSTHPNNKMPVEEVLKTLYSLGIDKTESKSIRKYALLKIRQPSTNPIRKAEQEEKLLSIFNNENETAEVRGAAITAMRRVGHPQLEGVVNAVISNPSKYSDIIVRHAVVTGAKSKILIDKEKIKAIASNTTNSEVYDSTVYALGIQGGVKGVKSLLSLYGQGDDHIVKYSLISNKKTILSMLNLNQTNEIISNGIKAAQIIKLHSAVNKLELIVENATDITLQKNAESALAEIMATPKSKFPSNSPKWEDK